MKMLYLVRHAKSSWDSPGMTDEMRPLNERGLKDAPKMGQYLHEKGLKPDAMISSPANRALTTAQLIADELGFDKNNIEVQSLLYAFTMQVTPLLHFIQQLPNHYQTVMLFGHNPTFTELSNHFSHDFVALEIPTCSVVAFQFDTTDWQQATSASSKQLLYTYPKMLNE
jgi:phosphohistidine phosphatase